MADKTKKPTGLKLTRKNDTFTASWKIADKDYGDGQAMQVRKGSGKWSPVSIGKKDKAKGFTVSRGDYYPNTKTVKGKTTNKPKLGSVSFRVRGNRKEYTTRKKVNGRTKDVQINPDVSDWSTKTFTVRKPNNPSISVSTGTWPTSTFSWSVKDSASDEKVYTRMKIDSVLLCDSNISKGKDVDWTKNINGMTIRVNGVSQTRTKYNGTSASASGTLTIQEDSGALQNGHSYTRWVRVIAQGPAGDSAPKYQKHVYADPNKAKIDSVALTPKTNGFRAQVKFSSPFGNSRPIKNVDVQWAVDTPAADLACPSGATWTTGKTVIVSDASGGAAFDIDQTIPENECLWFRVNTNWDDATTYGDPFYKAAGALTAPTITDITPNATNHTVTVTATNNASAIPDSFMVVRYYDEEEPDGFDIAVIPHGSTTATGVQCPSWETTPKFGVYAAVGDYSIIERDDGVDQYDVDAQMISQIQTQGGSVPEAPENVSLSATAIPGTIRVQWDWPWDEADSAELSWADHEDAWESTEGPETYTITKLHAAAWNISGLETGQTWYVRVRLIANNGDAVTYGAYSDTKTIDLSSAPLAPVITLTDHVIAEDGEVTASWSYSTTDGTAQAFAEVALVTYENGEPVYEPIAQTQTAQYITMNQETFDWQTGETYLFAVRVISASGRSSDAWSDPESLTIAEPPTCEITDTSLVEEEIEINPTTYTGDLLSFETESEETATALTIPLTPIQSLNGYDSPWVGGAGKNKLPFPYYETTKTENGVTFTVSSDGTVTVNGTATATTSLYVASNMPNTFGGMILNGSPSGSTAATCAIAVQYWNGGSFSSSAFELGNGLTLEQSDNIYILVRVQSGATINNKVFKPMIRLASETDATYAPYSNICPISGWDEVNVWDDPKYGGTIEWNQLAESGADTSTHYAETWASTIEKQEGTITVTTTRDYNEMGFNFVETDVLIVSGHKYYVAVNVESAPSGTVSILFNLASNWTSFALTSLSFTGTKTYSVVLTTSGDGISGQNQRLMIRASKGSVIPTGSKLIVSKAMWVDLTEMFGAGNEPTAEEFEELFPKTYYPYNTGEETNVSAVNGGEYRHVSVNLSDTAGTVYGGTLDVVSGALTVTHGYVDLGTLTWAKYTGVNSAFRTSVSDIKIYNVNETPVLLSSQYTVGIPANTQSNVLATLPNCTMTTHSGYALLFIRDDRYSDAASFKTAMNGVQLVYELATPQTYQLTPTQIMTLIGDNNVWSDAGEITLTIAEAAETVMALKDMPLTITVTGAQETQETQVAIERAAAYHVDRPDETDFNGFEGETVALATQVGDETFSFDVEDLIGRLDDGALYRIIATVQDGFGQAATDTVDFTVIWTEQATEPTAEVEMHGTAAYLTPIANEEGNPDDVCDIYRLSVDRPQLIYEGATFGETYVDPYPTIGEFGGHRFVTRTANGDYIMDDPETGDSLAWYDTGENEDDNLAVRYNIIDFDRGQAFLTYNADISGSWRKDFKETQYLGGSVQGDWNKAVSRTAQVNVTAVADNEQDLIQTMRRLADHTGLCHVRTKDGSSYPADVEVSESYNYASGVKTYEYQLTITRVDPEELDGMTLAEWNEIHDTGENTQ